MQLLISLLPFLLNLALVFQGPVGEAAEITITDLIAFSDDLNNDSETLQLFTEEPNFQLLARKLETEEKEVEIFDLFIDNSFNSTSFRFFRDISLSYFDFRRTHNNPHLYDLFHSWKTYLS